MKSKIGGHAITLLNSTYKFYSAILADRIKSTLNKLIHLDQKGFIENRFIRENIRITYDMIDNCKQKNIKGLIVLVDFGSVNERPLRVATVAYYNIIITCDVIKTVKSLISLI